MTWLKAAGGILAAMVAVWPLVYSPRGNGPKYAVAAALLAGLFLLLLVLWAFLHP